MIQELDIDKVISILEDADTNPKELEGLVNEHDLKHKLSCKCELCSEFQDYEYETPWWPSLQCLTFGVAVLNHPKCDGKLAKKLLEIAHETGDGDWILVFDEAHLSNSKRTSKELLDLCDNRTDIINHFYF